MVIIGHYSPNIENRYLLLFLLFLRNFGPFFLDYWTDSAYFSDLRQNFSVFIIVDPGLKNVNRSYRLSVIRCRIVDKV